MKEDMNMKRWFVGLLMMAMALVMIPSVVIALKTTKLSLDTLEKELRAVSLPIIARISKERMLFDVRTIEERHFSYINETLRKLCMK